MKVKGDLSQMWFQNRIKCILKALVIAFVMLVSPAFATDYNIYYDNNASVLNGATVTVTYSGAVQYYVAGSTLYYKTDVNASSWAFGSDMYLNSLSTTSTDFVFVGWCAFNSESAAASANYDCQEPKLYLTVNYTGSQNLNVSNGGDWYLYAKWAPIYNINYYDDSGQAINVSNTPLQYCVTGNSFRTREDLNNDYWGWDNGRLGELEKSGFAFAGWCAFASQADAAADNYTCDDPVVELGMDDSRWLNVSNGGDLYLYAKWAPIYDISYYDDEGQAVNVSNTPLQYWVTGNSVRTREDLNNDYWGWNGRLGELEKSGFVFAGWCAFASQADAAADNYTCDDPVVELGMSDYRGRLNVSNGGDLYLYAKWVTPMPVYNIYYDNMGADRDDNSAGRPGQYNVVASNVRTRIDSNADWLWNESVTYGPGPEKSGYEFRGWCAFDSAEAAAAADYNCQQPIEYLYTGSNCSNCLNVSNRGDLYLYAKWGGANSVNCSAGEYAYYDGSDLQCQYGCPANFYCDGLNSNGGSDLTAEDNGMHSCAAYDANKPFSGPNSSSSSACSACPEVDFSGITAPAGYQIGDFDALSIDLNGNGVNQAGECVAPVLLYNEMVLICSGYVPGTCDQSSMNAGLMSCRYDSSTGGYTNCSSMAGVCGAAELMSLISIAQSGAEGVLNTELSRKGLSQNNINWNTFFGSNNIANWDSSSSIVTDRTYCSTASVQCSAGEAARFVVDSNNALLTPTCVPCPNGFYCSNSDTYTFSDSVFVEHDANNNYDIYMAGMTACTGGVATTATGATDASFCMSGASPCVPDRDNNGDIISSRVPGGNILSNSDISGATKTPELVTFLDSNNEPYQACANVYVSALDSTALANSQLAEPTATLSEAGLRAVVCKYNTASGKYDLCSPAFTVCDSMYLGMLQLYNTPSQLASALAPAFSKGQSSYITDSKLSRVFNIDTIESANTCSCDTGFEWSESGNTCCPDGYACCLAGTQYDLISGECEQCSGANCPNTYNKYMASCPASNGTNSNLAQGVMELNMGFESPYGSTVDKCTEIRLYYDDPTPLMNGFQNLTVSDLVDAGASVAFCRYNTSTGNYDGDCTPKYSICENDNLSSFFGSGTTVGMMQYVLGLNNSNEISDSLFTVTSANLGAENVTNRCPVSCPDAGDYTHMSTGMIEMGDGLEGSYGETASDCVSMRIYYDDPTNLFPGNNPSMNINDWVDAGASIAFCKYNTGNSATDLCTPKYSLCSDDNMATLLGAGDTVGIMQALLGISGTSTLGTYFTETPSSLESAEATNRCHVSCPDASDYTHMNTGMIEMGDGLEGSYGETASDCVSMRIYYDDPTNLFPGNNPSMNINDWVDAGASIAFCKYNTGDSATDLCTPRYLLCSDDSMATLLGAGDTVGIMQALLEVNNPSALGTYFTETPSSLDSATATNRCAATSTTCSAGQYADANLECQACPANHYCTGLNSTGGSDLTVEDNGKYACPSGSTSNGSTSSCTCSTAGYEWNSTSHTCVGITVDIDWLGVDNSGAAATCTYGGSLTLPTPNPTLSGYTFAGWAIKTGKLPSNCTELEYIQSSGTQYINTGVNVQSGSVAEVDYQITGNTTSAYGWQNVYSNTAEPMFGYAVRKSASYGDAYSYLYVNGLDVTESVDLNKHTIRQESNNFYRDGTLVQTRPVSDFSSSSPVSLFARPQYGSVYHQMVGRIYSAKIWSDGTNLSFNGIPAQCNNVVGMYDTVSKTFLTNSGSGTFTAGPAVTQ